MSILEELREFPEPEFKNKYKVSNLGKILINSTKKYLKIYNTNDNGPTIRIKNSYLKIDEIVSKTFLGENPDSENILLEHIDKDLSNNNIINLRYISYEEYLEHTFENKWKKIKKYPEYYISSIGHVWSKKTSKILTNCLSNSGYFRICINATQLLIHRIVAIEFIENPKECDTVNHKNGDKTDNNVENLEWCSISENNLHSKNVLGNVNSTRKYEKCDPPEDCKELDWLKDYLITKDGKIYSNFTERYLTLLNEDQKCYKVEANGKRYRVHILVASAYLKKPSEEHVNVVHIDGDPYNNNVKNLKWATAKETVEISIKNNPDRYKKLSKKIACLDKDTQEIIKVYESLSEAAKQTKIDKGNIGKACKDINKNSGGFKWKYIEN
jgi:hypothetical protein